VKDDFWAPRPLITKRDVSIGCSTCSCGCSCLVALFYCAACDTEGLQHVCSRMGLCCMVNVAPWLLDHL